MTPTNKNNGCLWFFVLGLLSLFSFVLLLALSPLSTNLALIIAIAGSVFFLNLILGKPSTKQLIRSGISIYLLLFGLKFIAVFFINTLNENKNSDFKKDEKSNKTIVIKESDTTVLYSSNRNWTDNYGNNFNGTLSVREVDYQRLKNHINNFKAPINKHFWGSLYQYLEQKDAPSLDLVMQTFTQINKEKKLNKMEFAEMIVSCIQDIPYSFVLQGECPIDNYDDSNRRILEKCPECCIGNIAYGIQNPVSFLKNLKGDCDTRTVLIYSILKHFKYDVAIVNSDFYRHSIIGINLPASGDYKVFKGKKYVLWETTAKYYKAGELPINFNNITHWNVVLTSK
tara:strand:+ start:9322 stop:10344 length:1023 start_codon:yes stop_codon:yes gene_type:complete